MSEMKKIASFSIDHDKLQKGVYVSRVDGDVITYDIRMKRPNMGDYLSNGALHTFEHQFATYARNGEFAGSVIYIGPMGSPAQSARSAAITASMTYSVQRFAPPICSPSSRTGLPKKWIITTKIKQK